MNLNDIGNIAFIAVMVPIAVRIWVESVAELYRRWKEWRKE